jgi:hypothetical protein
VHQIDVSYLREVRHTSPCPGVIETLLPVLSKQLVDMSKIAWTKHRLVQLSMSLAPIGVVALVSAQHTDGPRAGTRWLLAVRLVRSVVEPEVP